MLSVQDLVGCGFCPKNCGTSAQSPGQKSRVIGLPVLKAYCVCSVQNRWWGGCEGQC